MGHGIGLVHIQHIFAGRFNALPALFREKIPPQFSFLIPDLFKPDQFQGMGGQILGVLVGADIACLFRRQIFPLLAGHLASPACGTQG
jgi:hypothetical protein